MARLPKYRAELPALALLVAAGATIVAVHRCTASAGGLRITREGSGHGLSAIRTGPPAYPRQAMDSDNYAVRVTRPVRRIASQYWSLDEFVYTVVPPERVVAVSASAYQRGISNVFRHAERFKPAISADPERILRQSPDLILVSNSARIDFCDLVRGAGIPIYRAFTMFTTLEQIAGTIRLTGYLTGEDAAAARETDRFWWQIRLAQSRRPVHARRPRILGLSGKYSYGDQTLFHDIVNTLGGVNVGAEGGLHGYDSVNTEQIVRWNPEWIVTGAGPGLTRQVLAQLLNDPGIALTQAARNGRILVVEHNVFLPLSPFTARFVTAIAEALYE